MSEPTILPRGCEISVSPGFILLAALIYFMDETGLVSAFVPAIAAHELGHIAALYFQGARITELRLLVSGLELRYSGGSGSRAGLFAAAASGPAAGLIFALIASYAGQRFESDFLLCSAGLSYILTLVNLIPALPLDGGRMLLALFNNPKLTALCTAAAATLLTAVGALALTRGFSIAPLLFGLSVAVLGRKTLESERILVYNQ